MASSSLLPYLILSLLHAVLLSLSCAQTNGRIRLGSSLTAQINQTDAWYSPSGEFAFGFHPLETDSSLFLLAIWFTKTADRTTVWYANGDRPVQAGSKVELTEDGKLNLTDHAGQAVWNVTNISNASYAGMLDTGNFKITRDDNTVAWQTFDDPRDTILPSKELAPGQELRSRLSETDYSVGKQKLVNQDDGNLVFYNVSIPSDARTGHYWASNTYGRGLVLVFDPSGSIYFTLNDGYRSNFTTAINYPTRDFYHRARLDPDGLFRQYVHPKNGTADEGWTLVDFQPDICLITENGNGGCGNNSYCKPRGNGSYDCLCPPQYSYVNPNKTKQGCRPNFPSQNCLADEVELEAQFDFTNLDQVEWRSEDYDKTEQGNEEQCRKFCLRDCECLAGIYENYSGRCRKKKLLSNGRMGANVNRTAFVKIPSERTPSEGKSYLQYILVFYIEMAVLSPKKNFSFLLFF